MTKIRFVQDHKVKQGDGKGPEYKAGQVVDFNGPAEETYAMKYKRMGVAEDHKVSDTPPPDASDADKAIASRAAALEERAKIEIPDDWADMKYFELRALGSSLSDTPIHNREEAMGAITSELARRAV